MNGIEVSLQHVTYFCTIERPYEWHQITGQLCYNELRHSKGSVHQTILGTTGYSSVLQVVM